MQFDSCLPGTFMYIWCLAGAISVFVSLFWFSLVCVNLCGCVMMIFTKFSYAFWFQLQDLYFQPEKALAFLFVASP